MNPQNTLQKLNPGSYYHIYNRGNNKEVIFKTPDNYVHFLNLWKKYVQPVAETFCYNLLPNHFHFFVRIREQSQASHAASQTSQVYKTCEVLPKPIEQHFSNLFNSYAKAINKRFNRTGSLFQERFRRKEINDTSYFTTIIGYIITNSAKHGFCSKANNYPYSAYPALLSFAPTLLLRNEVFDWW
jgi:putative transposase